MTFSAFFEQYSKEHLDYKRNKHQIIVAWRKEGYQPPKTSSYDGFPDEFGSMILEPPSVNDPFNDLLFIVGSGMDKAYQGKGYGPELYSYAVTVANKLGYRGIASHISGRSDLANKMWAKIPHDIEGEYAIITKPFQI